MTIFNKNQRLLQSEDVRGLLAESSVTFPLSSVGLADDGALRAKVTGDADQRLVVNNDGKMEWGGGTDAWDTNLYRSQPDRLQTDDEFFINGNSLYVDGDTHFMGLGYPTVTWSSQFDHTGEIIRSGIMPDGGDTFETRWSVKADGLIEWGPAGSNGLPSLDTNLYRGGLNWLKTDDVFTCLEVYIDQTFGQYNVLIEGWDTSNEETQQPFFQLCQGGLMRWGNGDDSIDTELSRSGVNALATPGDFRAAGALGAQHVAGATPTGGSSGDIKLGDGKIWVNDGGTWKSAAVA